MPRIDLGRVQGLPDILSTDSFEFILGAIPGGSTDRDMVIKCQQAVYPGSSQESFEMPLHGHVVNFRGRRMFPRTMSITYAEDRTFDTTRQIESWLEYIAGSRSGTSAGYKNAYTINKADLIVYDTTGAEVSRTTFKGLMPRDKPDVQLDGSSTQAWTVSVDFVYDTVERSGIAIR